MTGFGFTEVQSEIRAQVTAMVKAGGVRHTGDREWSLRPREPHACHLTVQCL
jgi:hypothetical protein